MDPSSFTSIGEIKWVDEWTLRKIFNDLRIGENPGEYRSEMKRSRPVREDKKIQNWIPGTESQIVKYFDRNNNQVAVVHRYQRPDGKLAASGMEDPKSVLHNGVIYQCRPSENKKT